MPRYAIGRPHRADDGEEEFWRTQPPLGHPVVFVPDPAPTGLLDVDGNMIYRLPDPIGFLA